MAEMFVNPERDERDRLRALVDRLRVALAFTWDEHKRHHPQCSVYSPQLTLALFEKDDPEAWARGTAELTRPSTQK